jgi:hypothetical protein
MQKDGYDTIKIMPSNKIIITFILSFALIISTWLIFKTPVKPFKTQSSNSVFANAYDQNQPGDDDWKKLLTDINPNTTSAIPKTTDNSISDDTTLTAQLSKDLFSRYLLAVNNGGQEMTSGTMQQITKDVLSLPQYTSVPGAVYLPINLKITQKTDKETILTYNNDIHKIFENRTVKNVDALSIIELALNSGDENFLKQIDPLIIRDDALIKDLLSINIPKDAVDIHLAVINGYSNVLASLQSMRITFKDPAKSLAGVSQYPQNILNLQKAITDMNSYFSQRLGNLK